MRRDAVEQVFRGIIRDGVEAGEIEALDVEEFSITFAALLVNGSCTERGTDGIAASWKTISQPRTAACARS